VYQKSVEIDSLRSFPQKVFKNAKKGEARKGVCVENLKRANIRKRFAEVKSGDWQNLPKECGILFHLILKDVALLISHHPARALHFPLPVVAWLYQTVIIRRGPHTFRFLESR
jgi:hypothetical protein